MKSFEHTYNNWEQKLPITRNLEKNGGILEALEKPWTYEIGIYSPFLPLDGERKQITSSRIFLKPSPSHTVMRRRFCTDQTQISEGQREVREGKREREGRDLREVRKLGDSRRGGDRDDHRRRGRHCWIRRRGRSGSGQ